MSKKSFQVRRTPPLYPTDVPQKPFEANLRVYRQAISNDPNIINQKSTQNKPSKEAIYSDNTPTVGSNSNNCLPKSAPSNPTKRVLRVKADLKDSKDPQKKNYGLGMITNYLDAKSSEQIKTSGPSKSFGGIVDDGIKSRSAMKRERTAGGKSSILMRNSTGEKRDESPTGLDASVINGLQDDNRDVSPKSSEDMAKQEDGQASPGKSETSQKFVEFTLSRIPAEREEYQEKNEYEMRRVSKEALGEDDGSNVQKTGGNLRGVFMKEHIPRSELQKMTEQKRLMKEFLDSQLDEKKRRKEEEKKREIEMEKKEEERIKKEIRALEQRLEKETNYDSKLKNKNQPNQIPDLKGNRGSPVKTSNKEIWEKMSRDGYRPNVSPVQTPETGLRNSYHIESQLKSPERKEFMEGKSRELQKSFKSIKEDVVKEHVGVDKLVQENKHLRDENTKKKEIIDLLISALNKNKEQQNGLSVIPEQVPPRGSPVSGNHPRNLSSIYKNDYFDPFSEVKLIKDRDTLYNAPLSNKNDVENRSIRPLYGRQSDDHKYYGDPRPSDMDIVEMPRKTSSGQIKNDSYNIFQPQPAQRDAESAQSHFRFGPSPRLGQAIRNGVYSSGAIGSGYNNDLKRSSVKNKNGFLPVLGDSPNSQVLYHRPNIQSMDMNFGVNQVRNLDTSKFLESPVRKDRERDSNISGKNGYSDTNLAMRDSSFKLGNDNLSSQKMMFDDIVYPSSTYIPGSYSNANFNSIKRDHGILVIDEGGSRIGSGHVKSRELDPLVVRQAKSQGMLVGLGGFSMVDMANSPGYNGVRMSEKSGFGDSEGVRLYARDFGGISERGVQAQTTMNKGKFPKEVFATNVKKKFFV